MFLGFTLIAVSMGQSASSSLMFSSNSGPNLLTSEQVGLVSQAGLYGRYQFIGGLIPAAANLLNLNVDTSAQGIVPLTPTILPPTLPPTPPPTQPSQIVISGSTCDVNSLTACPPGEICSRSTTTCAPNPCVPGSRTCNCKMSLLGAYTCFPPDCPSNRTCQSGDACYIIASQPSCLPANPYANCRPGPCFLTGISGQCTFSEPTQMYACVATLSSPLATPKDNSASLSVSSVSIGTVTTGVLPVSVVGSATGLPVGAVATTGFIPVSTVTSAALPITVGSTTTLPVNAVTTLGVRPFGATPAALPVTVATPGLLSASTAINTGSTVPIGAIGVNFGECWVETFGYNYGSSQCPTGQLCLLSSSLLYTCQLPTSCAAGYQQSSCPQPLTCQTSATSGSICQVRVCDASNPYSCPTGQVCTSAPVYPFQNYCTLPIKSAATPGCVLRGSVNTPATNTCPSKQYCVRNLAGVPTCASLCAPEYGCPTGKTCRYNYGMWVCL